MALNVAYRKLGENPRKLLHTFKWFKQYEYDFFVLNMIYRAKLMLKKKLKKDKF
jgi:hypothetical protein